ncbi:MAG: T9SS type A sorting domain-containing protein [Bacteroidales bacterium]
MKKAIFIFIFLVLAILTMAQKETVNQELSNGNSREVLPVTIFYYMNEFEESYYYDDFLGYNYDTTGIFELNTMDSDSLWCIGAPNKENWDTTILDGFSRPNALITDTISNYPNNNHSVFELNIEKPEWTYYYNYCWSRFIFQMSFICDTDTLKDGFFIEISFNGGGDFANILDTTAILSAENSPDRIDNLTSFRSSFVMDTIFGFSGNIRGGVPEITELDCFSSIFWWDDVNGFDVTNAKIRVHFVSDSIDNQRKGVLIDNLTVSVEEWCHYVDIDDFENPKNESVFVSPNPINENSKILFNNTENNLAQIRIFSNTGKLIEVYSTKKDFIEISKSEFNKGIYIFQIQVGDKYYNGKFVVV